MKLNSNQLHAVEYNKGPLRIIAGAGSGKTRVIISKILFLLNQGVSENNIYAITFTNKAASEMRNRIQECLKKSFIEIWISTYHSLCNNILRKEIHNLNFKNSFNIIDSKDKKKIIKDIYKKLYINKDINNKIDLKLIRRAASYISNWKMNLINFDDLSVDNELLLTLDNDKSSKYIKIYESYQKHLLKIQVLDFDDLIIYTYKLFLKFPDILKKYQNQIKFLLVDEFQDTNKTQFNLIKLLIKSTNNLTVVGDPNQNIYTWRGADSNLLLNLVKYYPNLKTIILNQNYRSNTGILNLANSVIKNNYNQNQNNFQKSLYSNTIVDHKPQIFWGLDYKSEVKKIIIEIKKFIINGYKYKDILILYRNNSLSREIEEQFRFQKIPFKVFGAFNFFDREEVKDLMSMLKSIYIKDDVSLERTIALIPKFGRRKLDEVLELKSKLNLSIYDAIVFHSEALKPLTKKILTPLIKKIQDYNQNFCSFQSLEKILKDLLEIIGYNLQLKKKQNSKDKKKNVNELKKMLVNFDNEYQEEKISKKMELFFDKINFLDNSKNMDENDDYVSLMTIHSSKGLENEIVFIVSLCEGIFPSSHSLLEANGIAEERRLLYVAITRAKYKLFLSYNFEQQSRYFNHDKPRYDEPRKKSRFLKIPSKFYEKLKDANDFNASNISDKSEMLNLNHNNGDTILHPIFGIGKIIEISQNRSTIKFEDSNYGTRIINPSTLKKIIKDN